MTSGKSGGDEYGVISSSSNTPLSYLCNQGEIRRKLNSPLDHVTDTVQSKHINIYV